MKQTEVVQPATKLLEDWTLLDDLTPLSVTLKGGAITGAIVGLLMLAAYWGSASKIAGATGEILLILFLFCLLMGILFAVLTVQISLWLGRLYKGTQWYQGWHLVGGALGGALSGLLTATLAGVIFARYCMYKVPLEVFVFAVALGPYLFIALTPPIAYKGKNHQRLIQPIVLALLSHSFIMLITMLVVVLFYKTPALTDWLMRYIYCRGANLLQHTAYVGILAGSFIGLSMGLMLHLWRYRAQIEDAYLEWATEPSCLLHWRDVSINGLHKLRNAHWTGALFVWLLDVGFRLALLLGLLLLLRFLRLQPMLILIALVALPYISLRIFREMRRPDLDRLMSEIGEATQHTAPTATFTEKQNARRIHKTLAATLQLFQEKAQTKSQLLEFDYDICSSTKLLILSDLHRGAGNQADDFQKCRFVYQARLQQLLDEQGPANQKSKLILLGDVEELWEEDFDDIYNTYADLYRMECQLVKEQRCYRVWGNHDIDFRYPLSKATLALRTLYKKNGIDLEEDDAQGNKAVSAIHEAIKINVYDAGCKIGIFYLVHGHQGTADSDTWDLLSRWFVRSVWRGMQNTLWISRNTPAQSVKLGDWHDHTMSEWVYSWNASQRDQVNNFTPVVLITGHTHHLLAHRHNHAQLPMYFNSGCCAYTDGKITGIEIEKDEIRLQRWKATSDIDPDNIIADKLIAESTNHEFELSKIFKMI